MNIRIMMGMSVHAISISVLCVVRVGIGLARALKRSMTTINSANTKPTMPVMM